MFQVELLRLLEVITALCLIVLAILTESGTTVGAATVHIVAATVFTVN